MKRTVLLPALIALAALCALASHRVLAQNAPPDAARFESVVGFDVTPTEGDDVFFSVLVRDARGNMHIDVYDGSGVQTGQIQLKPGMVPVPPIRPD